MQRRGDGGNIKLIADADGQPDVHVLKDVVQAPADLQNLISIWRLEAAGDQIQICNRALAVKNKKGCPFLYCSQTSRFLYCLDVSPRGPREPTSLRRYGQAQAVGRQAVSPILARSLRVQVSPEMRALAGSTWTSNHLIP